MQQQYAGTMAILVGMETENTGTPSVELAHRLAEQNKLDYVVGSVHHVLGYGTVVSVARRPLNICSNHYSGIDGEKVGQAIVAASNFHLVLILEQLKNVYRTTAYRSTTLTRCLLRQNRRREAQRLRSPLTSITSTSMCLSVMLGLSLSIPCRSLT